jgi:ribonuclease D
MRSNSSGARAYSFHASPGEIELASATMLRALTDPARPDARRFVGFDSEFTSGRVSLVQLATRDHCYLFHVHGMTSLPRSLDALLRTDQLVRVGFATTQDVSAMHATFGLLLSVLDVKHLVALLGGRAWGLGDATSRYCGYELEKRVSLCERAQWATVSERQMHYAAMDAFACVDLWHALSPTLACEGPPSALALPRPRFGLDSEAEIKAAVAWLQRAGQPGTSEESLVNRLSNSYAPWAKLDGPTRHALAIEAGARVWALLRTMPSSASSPSSSSAQRSGVSTAGTNERDAALALALLRQTHPPETPRKRTRLANQLVNSLGLWTQLPEQDKIESAEQVLEQLIGRGDLRRVDQLSLALARW